MTMKCSFITVILGLVIPTAAIIECHNNGCPDKKLHLYLGGCNSVQKSRSPDCVAAMHRFCNDKCSWCGGVSRELGDNVFGVICFESNSHYVSIQELQTYNSLCHVGISQSNDCISAIHHWCEASGFGRVGIAQEVEDDRLFLRCFEATWYGTVNIHDLRNQHGGCNNVSKGSNANCVAAIHRWCSANGWGSHGLAQDFGNGVISVACFDSFWHGNVAL